MKTSLFSKIRRSAAAGGVEPLKPRDTDRGEKLQRSQSWSLSRSIRVRKNASLHTTLHSFQEGDRALLVEVFKCPDDDPTAEVVVPLKGCLKVTTVEESLSSCRSTRIPKEESKEPVGEDQGSLAKRGPVSFTTVEIREHQLCLDENYFTTCSACTVADGVGLTLGWSIVNTHCLDVNDFQRLKGPVKDGDDLKLSASERSDRLLQWGVTQAEIQNAKSRHKRLMNSNKGARRIINFLKS